MPGISIPEPPLFFGSSDADSGAAPVDWMWRSVPAGIRWPAASLDGAVRLWDVTDPARLRHRSARPDQPHTGRLGYRWRSPRAPRRWPQQQAGSTGTIRLWDIADPAHPRPARPAPDRWHRRRRNGGVQPRRAHAGQQRRRRHYPVVGHRRSGAPPSPLDQPLTGSTRAPVYSVALGPGGHTLASGDYDGTIRLWDIADPAHPPPARPEPLTGADDRHRIGGVQPRRACAGQRQ